MSRAQRPTPSDEPRHDSGVDSHAGGGGPAQRRSLRRRLLALALGVTLALLAAEGLLRATGVGWYEARIDSYGFVKLDDDPERLHWGFDPAIISWHAWDGDPYDTLPAGERMNYEDVNDIGLRGPLPRAEDRPRLLFVGDSFTFGEGVATDATFVQATARLVAEEHGAPNFAMNAGVPGYGTFEEALWLPKLVEWFSPEVIVLVFVPNDAIHVSDAFGRDHDLLKTGGRGGWTPRTYELARLALTSDARTRETEEWYLSYYFGEKRAHWESARARLVAMREVCASQGTAFGVAYFPLLHDLGTSPLTRIRDEVAAACSESRIPFLDLTPTFSEYAPRDLWIHPVDHHPNARAHRLAAESLAPFVAGLLRESTVR